MEEAIQYFQQLLNNTFSVYFNKENEKSGTDVRNRPEPDEKNSPVSRFLLSVLNGLLAENQSITQEEEMTLLLALMPHISPETLDPFFIQNKDLDRPYTEFGGWRGFSHGGFLPTGQTAVFLLTQLTERTPSTLPHFLGKDHWFHQNNILHLEGQGEGEPFLSGRLVISDEALAKIQGLKYEPEYNAGFPAKRITTQLEWEDLVLPYNLCEELDDMICWIRNQAEIREKWQLNRIVKQGYRCLFYGPPGTGKTLTATLLGKQNRTDVYRVDLSMIVSKYIGETEKNLAKVFDKAEHQNWILFFDEADALFGQRTETQSSNDRHANQEVAYLLQRIEDFPGIVILATNLKENIDEAFFRRFQSALYFPMPDERLRYRLWKKMIPSAWFDHNGEELLQKAAVFNLSGGSMVNVIQTLAVKLYNRAKPVLSVELLKEAIRKELTKEGKFIDG